MSELAKSGDHAKLGELAKSGEHAKSGDLAKSGEQARASDHAKAVVYREIGQQLAGLFVHERNGLSNTANTAAHLFHSLPDLNWAGFYFLQGGELVLGPFQGKVACVRIAVGRGVCGTAAERQRTIIVPDVHAFPGHIACDSASRSEIVVPLIHHQRLLGVLDLDSPQPARFDEADSVGLNAIVGLLLEHSELGRLVD